MAKKNNLKKVLESEGITQAELARRSGISLATINRVYNAKRSPSERTISKILKAVNKLSAGRQYESEDIFPLLGPGGGR